MNAAAIKLFSAQVSYFLRFCRLIGVLLAGLMVSAGASAQTPIDLFTTAQAFLIEIFPDDLGVTSASRVVASDGSILGGERDILITLESGTVASNGLGVSAGVPPGDVFIYTTEVGIQGSGEIQWDGGDLVNEPSPADLNHTGLGGLDLLNNAGDGVILNVFSIVGTAIPFTVTVYTDSSNFSSFDGFITTPGMISLDFLADFVTAGGSGADFNNVGAITIRFQTGEFQDLRFSSIAATATILNAVPGLALEKLGEFTDENSDGVAQVGETIAYTFEVTNTGNVPLSDISVSDSMIASVMCPSGNPIPVLATGASEICTGSYSLTQGDIDAGQKDNTATANSAEIGPVTADVSISLPTNSSLVLAKSGIFSDENNDGAAQVGETIAYTFEVTNTGNVTLSTVSVTDPMVASIMCPSSNPIPLLAPGASEICTGSYSVTQADVNAGVKENMATATGQDTADNTVTATDVATTQLPSANTGAPVAIPTLSLWGYLLLNMLLLGTAAAFVPRKRKGL